jgi:hypothetical protein
VFVENTVIKEVEKLVEVPMDRVVWTEIEVPVDQIVKVAVSSTLHLGHFSKIITPQFGSQSSLPDYFPSCPLVQTSKVFLCLKRI